VKRFESYKFVEMINFWEWGRGFRLRHVIVTLEHVSGMQHMGLKQGAVGNTLEEHIGNLRNILRL
jgi:hypothetical protein